MATLHVACQARADYVPHSAAMLHSVLATGGMDDVHVHFLHGPDLGPEHLDGIRAVVEGHGGRVDFSLVDHQRVQGLAVNEQFPTAHWYRLFLPELLPDLDRVLYLDGDLIVLDELAPLWSTDLGDHYLGAVTNVFQADHFGRVPLLGLDDPDDYFNSGVMLLNLAQLRRDDATAAVVDWALANHARLDWPEQDALNVVLGHRRLRLHPRWNLMNSTLAFPWSMHAFGAAAVREAKRDPAIRHFEGPGPNKPWHVLCDPAAQALYARHRAGTPWPEVRLEGRSPATLARRAARRLRR